MRQMACWQLKQQTVRSATYMPAPSCHPHSHSHASPNMQALIISMQHTRSSFILLPFAFPPYHTSLCCAAATGPPLSWRPTQLCFICQTQPALPQASGAPDCHSHTHMLNPQYISQHITAPCSSLTPIRPPPPAPHLVVQQLPHLCCLPLNVVLHIVFSGTLTAAHTNRPE